MLGVLVSAVTTVLVYSLVLMSGLWCWFQWKNWDFIQAAGKLPCLKKRLPFLGHAYLLLRSWEDTTQLALDYSYEAVTSGLYNVCFWCGPLPVVMLHKIEDIERFLVTSGNVEKGDEVRYLDYAIGTGLLTAPVHLWKMTRRHISPLFHPRNIEQLMHMFNCNSAELVVRIAEHADGQHVNMLRPVASIALKSVSRKYHTNKNPEWSGMKELIFGMELVFKTKSRRFKNVLTIIENVSVDYIQRIATPWLRIDFIFQFLYKKRIYNIKNNSTDYIDAPLKVAKVNNTYKFEEGSSNYRDSHELALEAPLNLIDVYTPFQKKYPQFTDKHLKDEIFTLFGTGTDTIGITVSTCLLVLSTYPDVQGRVYEEITSVVGPDSDVTVDHITKMQYLDQVFRETLRWANVVPYIVRKTSEELKLSTCTIPAGNSVVVCLIGPHMDPKIYPEPRNFNPDRFSAENSTSRKRHDFIPFGLGNRMCIGKTYSEFLIKTMLVHVLRKYRVTTDMDIHNLKKVLSITLANFDGYNIKFQNRK